MTDTEFHQMIDARRDVIEAFLNKRKCEARRSLGTIWIDLRPDNFMLLFDPNYEVRIKPQPKLVPWTSIEQVPLNDWFRRKRSVMLIVRIIETGMVSGGLRIVFSDRDAFTMDGALEHLEHSPDPKSGNWFPCGTEVEG